MQQPKIGDSADSIHDVGHRNFVGGNERFWQSIADLQYDFLLSQGLAPSDVMLDIACGSLRAGHKLIRYLDPGRYLGLDKHIELIIYGVCAELGIDTYREKRPRFIISDRFEFTKSDLRPRFALAQSLFTHLSLADIELCLRNLGAFVEVDCRFFCTFFERAEPQSNPPSSHSHLMSITRGPNWRRQGNEPDGWRTTSGIGIIPADNGFSSSADAEAAIPPNMAGMRGRRGSTGHDALFGAGCMVLICHPVEPRFAGAAPPCAPLRAAETGVRSTASDGPWGKPRTRR